MSKEKKMPAADNPSAGAGKSPLDSSSGKKKSPLDSPWMFVVGAIACVLVVALVASLASKARSPETNAAALTGTTGEAAQAAETGTPNADVPTSSESTSGAGTTNGGKPAAPADPNRRDLRPAIGFSLSDTHSDRSEDDPSPVIVQITGGSPASKCGLQLRERVYRVDGRPVLSSKSFDEALAGKSAPAEVNIMVGTKSSNTRSVTIKVP